MKQQSKYSETLVAHACHKAYAALRKHYGPDPNDLNDPRGVEQAIRRDVIAVLGGATAKQLHKQWTNCKFENRQVRCTLSHAEYTKAVASNPTLAVWRDIPDHDKAGFRLFCAKVHEARREYDDALYGDEGLGALKKFPQTFNLVRGKEVKYAENKKREEERLESCGQVAQEVHNAFCQALGYDIRVDGFSLEAVADILKNPSAPALYLRADRRGSGTKKAWHEQSKQVQSLYTIYVAALVAAAERYDSR